MSTHLALVAHLGSDSVKDRIPKGDRSGCVWTPDEDSALETYFEQGMSDAVIARRLRRTEEGVIFRRSLLGLQIDGWRAVEVAAILGVHKNVVTRLIELGHIRARKHGSSKPRRTTNPHHHAWWIITEDDLGPFLHDPLNWHVWTPSSDDSAIREWTAECRGTPYLTIADVMRRYPGVRGREDWIRAIRCSDLPDRRDYQGRRLLSDEEAATLAIRQRTWRAWTPLEDRRLKRLQRAGVTYAQMATALGRTKGAVRLRLLSMGLTANPKGRKQAAA